MKLSDLLKTELIIPELTGTTKEEVINEMVDLFDDDPRVDDIQKVRTAVFEREKIISTGIGKNFALPHGKTDSISEILCAFGKSSRPIEYNSHDGQPVHLVFLLVGKENLVSLHIKLLSRISRMMTKDEFRRNLMEAKTAAEILEIFKTEEETYYDNL
ncbi:MAG: PTS sugar transporter subunit IIA [Ignavibacteriales bacterium]|nr:MAG: PTS sugar transporter subunit IIA [Ignavibacteriaceae bacterium]MBW7872778.1 PTS sugar transporter subunit IIA [Ignavibacteria bacterium]MCZ2143498.1 PTS sugar transporter subunit IIA [Ignavibacteriales bacterium]OQY72509.1 MAG: PTS sugar transporter subunit IIA [Ignavibacteriales bacterium UTCHB3]MBV6444375.1 PTS system fructose-specific EIIABC component [Ignavibacteriaceae bacterium]